MRSGVWLVVLLATDVALGLLVTWRVLGPFEPSRRASLTFAGGVCALVPLLCVSLFAALS